MKPYDSIRALASLSLKGLTPATGAMDDLVHGMAVPVSQDFRSWKVERRRRGIERAALADGNVDVRRRHCVRIDAVGQQHVPVFGQLAEKYPHGGGRQMLEHVRGQQEMGRRKIQFDDVADK